MSETTTQGLVLQAIDIVHQSCEATRVATSDLVVESMSGALATIRAEAEARWPLTPEYKDRIAIGPVAAKNLSDWQPELADMLMNMDHILRHDGAGVDAFLAAQAGSVIGARQGPASGAKLIPSS